MKAFDLSVLQSGYKHPGGGREALWPSGQYAAVGGDLGEGFRTAGVLIPAVGDVTEILDSSFSIAFITFAASAVPPSITQCHPARNQLQFLSSGLIIFLYQVFLFP